MVDFERARRTMVDNQLRTRSITDRRLLRAMGSVPRERFVPPARRTLAYIDEAHPLLGGAAGRALPAPASFAQMVQLAAIVPTDAVLDLGCGTGYTTAVLASLAAHVTGVDDHPELTAQARGNLQDLGIANVTVLDASLRAGPTGCEPFDVIIVEGAVEQVPEALFAHLAEGGRLVAAVQRGVAAVANLYVRSGSDVAAFPGFDTRLPPLVAPDTDEFVF